MVWTAPHCQPQRATAVWTLALLLGLALPAGAQEDAIATDGFESGDLCAWTSHVGGSEGYAEAFPGADGSSWPGPWTAVGSVALADLQGGQARFRPTPSSYSLARLFAPIDTRDVEVRFTVEFEDVSTQGVGFYVRQNGGYLQQSNPAGEGYAVFVEGFRDDPGIGVWREIDGEEIPIDILFDPALDFQDGVPYRVHFRVNQVDDATTLLQAKVWPVGQAEPAAWHVTATDSSPELQGISGGIALDSWSELQSPTPINAHTLVDDVEVAALCNPLAGAGPLTTVADNFIFTEGPAWRDGHLLFTDIEADTIFRLDPPAAVTVFRTPSGRANGLVLDVDGDLLAAEQTAHRLSRTDGLGNVTTFVDSYQGMRLNAPNDVAVRSDGTVYFTDPDYGLIGDRELPFNGLFRLTPGGTLVAEWEGVPGMNEPNGVVLSPDEQLLFVTDTEAGQLLAWDVAPDGSLANQRAVASDLFIPDGLCVDRHGNVYVATWASTVEVFTPDGTPWGAIPIPLQATNCGFGGSDARTLYVTAHQGLYEIPMPLPGIR